MSNDSFLFNNGTLLFKNGLKSINFRIFDYVPQFSVTKIQFPEGLEYVGDSLFSGCSNLKEIIFPSKMKFIGNETFSLCSKLKKITFPKEIEYIGDYTFHFCTNLKKITLPQRMIYIGNYTFGICSNLQKVTFPKKIERIGKCTFSNCNELKILCSLENVMNLDIYAFLNCPSIKYKTGYYKLYTKEMKSAFSEDGVVYRVGETYTLENDNPLKLGDRNIKGNGFHFCDSPIKCLRHYYAEEIEDLMEDTCLCEIQPLGDILTENGFFTNKNIRGRHDNMCCRQYKILRKIPFDEAIQLICKCNSSMIKRLI